MVQKIVRYNGSRESIYYSSSSKLLVLGKNYEVIAAFDRGWQTNLKLKGIEGEFNSAWFDVVETSKIPSTVYMAVTESLPNIGERMNCYKIVSYKGKADYQFVMTSSVRKIEQISSNIYSVMTRNSTYIVQIL